MIVLLGLVECEERKTLTGLRRVIGESVSLSGVSRFLNQWRWSTTALAYLWGSYFCERMVEPVQAEVEVSWPSANDEQKLYAHLVPTWVRELGPTLVLMTCHDPEERLKFVR